MKPTGIVRRIDDLGRVVMPKELRRTLRIREGDPLEIYVADGSVMLKKYTPSTPEIGDYATDYAKTLSEVTGCIALVADKDSFVSVAGAPQREYVDKPIPESWAEEVQKANSGIFDDVDEGTGNKRTVAYANVVYDEKKAGLVVLMTKGNASIGDLELKLVQTAADFIAKQMKR
ncbi:MAG TPA: stage V sporulation T C-terminal domain-containing protein [Selenomonadales bacterium]|nr:stage V sporulation T C-terminal domain-containing protein [Selenomonadales bacterium]